MSRNATLPFGEIVTIADNTPTLVLGTAPGNYPNGEPRYGPAPWAMQGATLALTPRLDAQAGRPLPTPAERDGAANGTGGPGLSRDDLLAAWATLELELRTLEQAKALRTTPALGVAWYLRAGEGLIGARALVTVAASTVPARTPVLVWLDASQRPAPMAAMDGHGWCPATIDAHSTRDVEPPSRSGGRLTRGLRRADGAWSQAGVWFVSVPFRARLHGVVEGIALYDWAPTDTTPGTEYLPPDGFGFLDDLGADGFFRAG